MQTSNCAHWAVAIMHKEALVYKKADTIQKLIVLKNQEKMFMV